jgi:hypothetical protein
MLLLIDIFSINKGRGYENPSLEIIVTERCSTGGCPLEEAREHCFLNQSVISVVVLISFLCYCGDYAGYITVILPFLAFYFYSAYFLYLVYYSWVRSSTSSSKSSYLHLCDPTCGPLASNLWACSPMEAQARLVLPKLFTN